MSDPVRREGRAADVARAVCRVFRQLGGGVVVGAQPPRSGLSIDDLVKDAARARSKLWGWEATAALGELEQLGLVRPPVREDVEADARAAIWRWWIDASSPASLSSLKDSCRSVFRVLGEVRRWGDRWVDLDEIIRAVCADTSSMEDLRFQIERGIDRLFDAGLVEVLQVIAADDTVLRVTYREAI